MKRSRGVAAAHADVDAPKWKGLRKGLDAFAELDYEKLILSALSAPAPVLRYPGHQPLLTWGHHEPRERVLGKDRVNDICYIVPYQKALQSLHRARRIRISYKKYYGGI